MTVIFVLGLAVGLVLALTGAGGGMMAVPLLVFFTDIDVAQAAPIGLVAVGMGAGVGAALGLKAGIVRYRAALLIAACGMMISPLGIALAQCIDNRVLLVLYALVLVGVAWASWKTAQGRCTAQARVPVCIRDTTTGRFIWTTPCARALVRAGGVAGLLSGLLGVGGGFVIVPALQRSTDLPMASSVATSLAVIFLVSLQTTVLGISSDNLKWLIALPFGGGTLAGMLIGRGLSDRIMDNTIRTLFSGLAAAAAVAMVVIALFPSAKAH